MQLQLNARKPSRVIFNRLTVANAGRPSAPERDAVIQAVQEGRDLPERAVDIIVDRLLKELSW